MTEQDSLQNIIQDYNIIQHQYAKTISKVEKTNKKIERRIKMCNETDDILDKAEEEFTRLTSIINKKDLSFFIFSVLLQCGIKYIIKMMRDMSNKELAKRTPFHSDEHSNRLNTDYYASREEIITNPVPFDAIQKNHDRKWYKENRVILPGFNGFNHRFTAIGHDPILGLIFGTANIMTATITRNDFISWHVKTLSHTRTSKTGEQYFAYLDTVAERASTIEIFKSIGERLHNEGKEGFVTLGCALLKEIVHLFTDLPSACSLPIPIISTFDANLARKLSFYGLNTGTIVQGSIATEVINWTIAFLHGLTRKPEENERLFCARTQKILMDSNLIATFSDLGYSLFTAYMGDKNTMRKFDLGGYIVTLSQICTSSNVISSIEREFYTNTIIQKFQNA